MPMIVVLIYVDEIEVVLEPINIILMGSFRTESSSSLREYLDMSLKVDKFMGR